MTKGAHEREEAVPSYSAMARASTDTPKREWAATAFCEEVNMKLSSWPAMNYA